MSIYPTSENNFPLVSPFVPFFPTCVFVRLSVHHFFDPPAYVCLSVCSSVFDPCQKKPCVRWDVFRREPHSGISSVPEMEPFDKIQLVRTPSYTSAAACYPSLHPLHYKTYFVSCFWAYMHISMYIWVTLHWVAPDARSRPERPGTERAPSSPIGPRPPCFHRQDTDFWVPSDWPHATARGGRRPRPPGGSIGLQKQAAAFRWKGGKVENVWHRLN